MGKRVYLRVQQRRGGQVVRLEDITAESPGRHKYILRDAQLRYDGSYIVDIVEDNPRPEGNDPMNRGEGT
jgi:hypothetical protein